MIDATKLTAFAAAFALTVGALGALTTLPAGAQDASNPIEQRQKLMKQNGKDAKAAGQMLKGEAAFDPAKVEQIFSEMHDVSMKFGDLFPEDSKTGGKTEAAPTIWTKPEAFKAALTKFQGDTKTAMDAKPQSLDAFKQQFGMVAENCKSCHKEFRVEKD